MVTVLDLNFGNIGSVINMLHRLDIECCVTASTKELIKAERIIIPGVGGFKPAALELNRIADLRASLKQVANQTQTPILGICLGMQLLFEKSEEGEGAGLGLIKGEIRKLNAPGKKIPHMGWNRIEIRQSDAIFEGIDKPSRFYFVHSFAAVPKYEKNTLATTDYGQPFCSVVKKGNVYGVQFHPEKSHKFGMRLLKNFCEITDVA